MSLFWRLVVVADKHSHGVGRSSPPNVALSRSLGYGQLSY